jgi:hypothetical protein
MKTIIIIIILIIIILYISTYVENNLNNTEHFAFSDVSNNILFNKITKNYTNNNTYKTVANLKLQGNLTTNEQELSNYIINLKYPVGSYYIQYPENNNNNHWETEDDLKKIKDQDLTFPKSKSPAVLFGGKWENIFKNEGVYFRTPGMVANEGRINGYQGMAINNLYGITSLSQTNLWNPGYGVNEGGIISKVLLKNRIGTDGKKKSDRVNDFFKEIGAGILAALVIAVAVFVPGAQVLLVTVVPQMFYTASAVYLTDNVLGDSKLYKETINTMKGPVTGIVNQFKGYFAGSNRGSDTGHHNILDTSTQTIVSPSEIRIRNRLIKVWKRVE